MRDDATPSAVSLESAAPVTRKPPLVLTTCSAGKRCRQQLRLDDLPRDCQAKVASAWLKHLRSEIVLTRAGDLYRGRAFGLARRVATEMGADLAVVSAGLGYVREQTLVPAYDVTVRKTGPGSVPARVIGDFTAEKWWQAIQAGPFSTDPATDLQGRDLVLVCLSRAYAEMVATDLLKVVQDRSATLRIFGLSIAQALPDQLRPFVMPYDSRLETVSAAGTRVDFPQRALADFVEHILPLAKSLETQRAAVLARMGAAKPSPGPRRQRRADDATVKAHIKRLIPTIGTRSSAILMHLRRVEGVSCEQSRFAHLFQAAKAEMAR